MKIANRCISSDRSRLSFSLFADCSEFDFHAVGLVEVESLDGDLHALGECHVPVHGQQAGLGRERSRTSEMTPG